MGVDECDLVGVTVGSFYGRTPRGHAILAPHLPRFGLYLSYIFIILGKVLMPIITFVSLSDIAKIDF